MLFTEFSFIFIFLPITLAVFFSAGSVGRQVISLAVASLIFYAAWNIYFLPLLIFSVISSFWIAGKVSGKSGRTWLVVGICVSIAPLLYFKYSGFISENLNFNMSQGVFGEELGTILPLGISFYTFQQITFLIDVHQRRAQRDGLAEYLFYIVFFPQLIAGPIIHYNQIIPQIGRTINLTQMFYEGA